MEQQFVRNRYFPISFSLLFYISIVIDNFGLLDIYWYGLQIRAWERVKKYGQMKHPHCLIENWLE